MALDSIGSGRPCSYHVGHRSSADVAGQPQDQDDHAQGDQEGRSFHLVCASLGGLGFGFGRRKVIPRILATAIRIVDVFTDRLSP